MLKRINFRFGLRVRETIFDKILSKEVPSTKVYEDDNVIC